MNVTNNHREGFKLVEFPKYTTIALKNGHDDLYFYNKITDERIP